MKKFLAIALSVLMILSVLPLSAFATVAATDEVKIGDVGYATLADAFAAAKSGDTITLLKDVTVSTNLTPGFFNLDEYKAGTIGSLTIDGKKSDTENYKINVTGSGKFGIVGYYNLTMKNVDVDSQAMNTFQWEGYNHRVATECKTWFENCNFVQNRANDGALFKITGNGPEVSHNTVESNYDITFKNCYGTTTDAVFFLLHHGTNHSVNFINSEFVFADTSKVAVGNAMFNVFHCGSVEINVDKDSKLIAAAGTPVGNDRTYNYLFNVHDMSGSAYADYVKARTVSLNLEEGATLKVAGNESRTDNKFINGAGAVTINDAGANWVIGAESAKNGVNLPVILDEGYKAQDWFVGDAVVANPYVNAEATEDVVLTHKYQTLAADADKAAVVYTDAEGAEQTLGTYKTLDAAFEALATLYAGPLADASIVDGDDEDTNLNNEIYAAAGSPVIKLLGNFSGEAVYPDWITTVADNAETTDVDESTTDVYDPNKVVTIVVDGAKSANENYTISCGAITLFDRLAYYNFTLKNTNLVFDRGNSNADNNILWNGRAIEAGESFTLFENCYIDQNSTLTDSDQGGLFKLNGFKKANADADGDGVNDDTATNDIFNVTFKDCTIFCATAVGLQVHWGASANIDVINTTMTFDGAAGKGNNNDTLIKFYECGEINFHMDGTSKLISAKEPGAGTATLIRDMASVGEKVVYEFDKGAQLIMNNTGALTLRQYIASAGADTTVIDNGIVFSASAEDVKAGVTLPSVFYDETGTAHIWQVDGFTVENPYTNAEATADVVFKHVKNEDPALNPNNVAFIAKEGVQTRYFDNLQDALNAATDGDTVTLLRDITATAAFSITNKNLTIDGKGFTLSDNDVDIAYVFDIFNDGGDGNFAVTFQNLKMKTMRGIRFRNAEINVIGCEFTTGKMLPIRAAMTSGLNVKFTVKDTTWKFDNITMGAMNSADEPFALFGDNAEANFEFNLVNSTLDLNKGNDTGGHTSNASGFNFYTKGDVTINMDATSKIVTHSTMMAIFSSTGNDKSITINLAKGATLEMNNSRTSGKSNFVLTGGVPCTINDEGANWIIGAEAAKNGLALPTVGGNSTWIVNGQLISAGEPYKNAEATESVKAEIFDMNSAATLMNGAGYKEGGIAFGMTVSDALIEIVGEDAKFGILVASEFNATFGFGDLNPGQYIDLSTDVEGLKDAGEGKKTCILGFDGIPTDNYHATHLDLMAIGYIEYVNDAGETVVIYTPNTYTISYAELEAAAAK